MCASVAGSLPSGGCHPISGRLWAARGLQQHVVRRRLDDEGEVAVERRPQRDEVRPRRLAVALDRDPHVLVVAGELQIVLHLPHHETAVVVRRRVDEVPDHLARRPRVRRRAAPARLFVDRQKPSLRAVDGRAQVGRAPRAHRAAVTSAIHRRSPDHDLPSPRVRPQRTAVHGRPEAGSPEPKAVQASDTSVAIARVRAGCCRASSAGSCRAWTRATPAPRSAAAASSAA